MEDDAGAWSGYSARLSPRRRPGLTHSLDGLWSGLTRCEEHEGRSELRKAGKQCWIRSCLPIEATNAAVLEAIVQQVLSPTIIDAAIERAAERPSARPGVEDDVARLRAELRRRVEQRQRLPGIAETRTVATWKYTSQPNLPKN